MIQTYKKVLYLIKSAKHRHKNMKIQFKNTENDFNPNFTLKIQLQLLNFVQ